MAAVASLQAIHLKFGLRGSTRCGIAEPSGEPATMGQKTRYNDGLAERVFMGLFARKMDKFGGSMKKKKKNEMKEKGFWEYDYESFIEVSKRVMQGRSRSQQQEAVKEVLLSMLPHGALEQFRKLFPPTKWAAEFNAALTLKLEKVRDMKMERTHVPMMTRISTPDSKNTNGREEDIMDSVFNTWKLYDNPYYCCSQSQQHQQQRKSFIWDLNFIRVFMEAELDKARAEIKELKAELDYERKARRRAELMNRRMAKDVEEERMGREAEEMQYKRLLKERSSEKSEMVRMKGELEEERQMHRLADVLREERVQMKLSDARLFLEEKLSELEDSSREGDKEEKRMMKPKILERACSTPASRRLENPHIKRGIKGFVEFPRVMRAIRSKGEQWGSKLECQKVQLKTLLGQKTNPRCASLRSSA